MTNFTHTDAPNNPTFLSPGDASNNPTFLSPGDVIGRENIKGLYTSEPEQLFVDTVQTQEGSREPGERPGRSMTDDASGERRYTWREKFRGGNLSLGGEWVEKFIRSRSPSPGEEMIRREARENYTQAYHQARKSLETNRENMQGYFDDLQRYAPEYSQLVLKTGESSPVDGSPFVVNLDQLSSKLRKLHEMAGNEALNAQINMGMITDAKMGINENTRNTRDEKKELEAIQPSFEQAIVQSIFITSRSGTIQERCEMWMNNINEYKQQIRDINQSASPDFFES